MVVKCLCHVKCCRHPQACPSNLLSSLYSDNKDILSNLYVWLIQHHKTNLKGNKSANSPHKH